MRVLETFPFDRQPNLKKKFVLDLYDTLEFMRKPQSLIYIGPTGCGKTGLATSFLVHAINQGHRGLWMDFKVLLDTLWSSIADHSEKQIVKRFAEVDCLVIDELGHIPIKKEQAGLFFDLMKRRHGNKTTLITTQLGYDEWADFLQNKHLTAAMLDRMTENCTVFNMKKCISIRPKNVQYATNSTEDEN
jgi:DNA replication protein DnaC